VKCVFSQSMCEVVTGFHRIFLFLFR